MRLLTRLLPLLLPLAVFAQTPSPAVKPQDEPRRSSQSEGGPVPALPPAPSPAPETINPALPTLWVASDSTAANRGPELVGWGVPLADYFDLTKVNIVNRAVAGRSSRTFITEGRWDKLLEGLKAGDFVLIQFGHNDASPVNEDASVPRERMRSRGSIRSLGEETQEIDNVITGKHEIIHTYGWYMRKMVADVKAKGATPVILSITIRNEWKDGKVDRIGGPWRQFSRDIAKTAGIAYIDLSRLIADEYQKLGPEKVKALFPRDSTHTGAAGADINAALVVSGLKGIRRGPFTALLSAKGAAVESDRIGYLNLPEPADPKLPSIVLIGDSLVRNGTGEGGGGQWGWGDSLDDYFDPAKANVVNRAIGGLSSRTFLTQGHWDRALTLIKPGDYVLIQLGHNDGGAVNDTSRARATLKGTGEETEEIDNLLTKQHEVVHTYGWYIRKYVREAKAAGATPVVLSLTPRKTWQDGKIVRSGADGFGGWARDVAAQEGVAFIDVNGLVARRYEALGPAQVDPLFGDPNLHTSLAGADLNAQVVTAGLRALPGAPVDAWLNDKGRALPAGK